MKDTCFFSSGERFIVKGSTVPLGNLGTEGERTRVQVPTLALSSCTHLDKCSHFSKPRFFSTVRQKQYFLYSTFCKDYR